MFAYWFEDTGLRPNDVDVWDKPANYLKDFDPDVKEITGMSSLKYLRLTTSYQWYDYLILSESATLTDALKYGIYYFVELDHTAPGGYTPSAYVYDLVPDYWAMYQRTIGDTKILNVSNGAMIRGHALRTANVHGALQTPCGDWDSWSFSPFGVSTNRRFYVCATYNAATPAAFWGTSAPPAVMLMTQSAQTLDTILGSTLDHFIHALAWGQQRISLDQPFEKYADLKDLTALYLIPEYVVAAMDAETYLDDVAEMQYGSYRLIGVTIPSGYVKVIRPRTGEGVYTKAVPEAYDMSAAPARDVLYRYVGNPSAYLLLPPDSHARTVAVRLSFDRVGATLSISAEVGAESVDLTPSLSASIVATSGNAEATQQKIEKTLRLGLAVASTAASGGSLAPLALNGVGSILQGAPKPTQSGGVVDLLRSLYYRGVGETLYETSGIGFMNIYDSRQFERRKEQDEFGFSGFFVREDTSFNVSNGSSHKYQQWAEGSRLRAQNDIYADGLRVKEAVEAILVRGVRIHSTGYWRQYHPGSSTAWDIHSPRESV